jgi:hypothetical protein
MPTRNALSLASASAGQGRNLRKIGLLIPMILTTVRRSRKHLIEKLPARQQKKGA